MTSRGERRVSAKEKAYEYIKSNIVNMNFSEGEFITEGQIAQALNISRTPVREAFLLLEAEELVKLFPQKGALIPPISLREMEEVMEARTLIEIFAVERAARRPDEMVPGLREIMRSQAERMAAGDSPGFISLDRRFHDQIVSASGNQILIRLYQGLRDRQMRMGIQAVMNSPRRMQQVLEEHGTIVAALESGDANRAREAIRDHLRATLAVLQQR